MYLLVPFCIFGIKECYDYGFKELSGEGRCEIDLIKWAVREARRQSLIIQSLMIRRMP